MSPRDVHRNEMDGNFDFDDETTEEFLRGTARDVDPQLADLIGDMRVAYTSTPPAVGSELAAFIGATEPASTPQPRRFERMRSSIFAKIGAATAAVVAATGGLAVAGALPAPVQDAMSHIGVGAPSHHDKSGSGVEGGEETTTTVVGSGETTTAEPGDDSTTPTTGTHGDDVSGVAHQDDGSGCEHGQAVSAVASDGKSQHPDCPTTPTSVGDNHGRDGNQNDGNQNDGNENDGGDNNNGTPPTSVPNSGGGDHHSGGGDHQSGGGDQNGGDQSGGSQDGGSGGGN